MSAHYPRLIAAWGDTPMQAYLFYKAGLENPAFVMNPPILQGALRQLFFIPDRPKYG
jgi:hypothetical protein